MNPLSFLLGQGRRAVSAVDDLIIRDLVRANRAAGPEIRKAAAAGSIPAELNIVSRTRPFQASAGLAVGANVAGVAEQLASKQPPATGGQALDRFVSSIVPDSIERPLMNFAREQEKKGFGGVLELATPLGFLAAPFIPNSNAQAATRTSSRGDVTGRYIPGKDQKVWDTDRTPAPNLTSSFNPMTASAPDRTYEVEKQRVAQLAAQDQLTKKYQVADLTKAYNAAKTPEEKEKLGLQIWATTNPQLAQKLKPGQLGYTEATSAFMSSSPLGSYVKSVGDMQFADKVSFPGEPVAGAFNLETPISGITLPENLKQIGVAEKFGSFEPGIAEAIQMGYSNPLQLFKPNLTQTQQALLRQAFEKGLK